jgi:azurin
MKIRILPTLLVTAGLLAGGSSLFAAAAAPRVVTIEANDSMRFNVTAITAAPGEEIKVVLKNVGAMPKAAMGHNWVLLKAGTDANAFSAAASAAGPAVDYIPAAMKDAVVAATKMTGGGETVEVTFKVPATAGDYPFLCTFPAHFMIGMKGVLTVK